MSPGAFSSIHRKFLLACALLLGTASAGAEEALQILEEMAQAADALDYSGEFVYVSNGQISTLKIVHMQASEQAPSQQKLMALDGSMREIILQNDVVACVLPDQGMGVREKRQARQLFTLNLSDRIDSIDRYYRVTAEGAARVASRNCDRIKVSPRDEYRYGYSLCVDQETRLLLSTELSHPDGHILESYKFVSVEFEEVKSTEIDSGTPADSLNWMDDQPAAADESPIRPGDTQKWRVSDNPAGFELEYYIERISPLDKSPVTHLVLTDGLAQVSVFVSAVGEVDPSATMLNLGSLNGFREKIEDHVVTVMGEVPQATVELIAGHTEAY